MKRQRILLWTGGHPDGAKGCEGKTDTLPYLLAPAPLRCSVIIEYQWGPAKFEVVAGACSVRSTPWGSEQMTWLHCKAAQTTKIRFDEPVGLMTILFPAHYVTGIRLGPAFHPGRRRPYEDDIGVFPPNQSAPADALPLADIERFIAQLVAPEQTGGNPGRPAS